MRSSGKSLPLLDGGGRTAPHDAAVSVPAAQARTAAALRAVLGTVPGVYATADARLGRTFLLDDARPCALVELTGPTAPIPLLEGSRTSGWHVPPETAAPQVSYPSTGQRGEKGEH